MYRFKQLFRDRLTCRQWETQVTEAHSRVAALNVMTYLGMPVSVPLSSVQDKKLFFLKSYRYLIIMLNVWQDFRRHIILI